MIAIIISLLAINLLLLIAFIKIAVGVSKDIEGLQPRLFEMNEKIKKLQDK